MKSHIEFFRHNISSLDIQTCTSVLKSIFLTMGELVKQFEHKFAAYLGIEYVIGVSSCTDALFLSLKYYGIGPGDEVITTPMSFVATANAIEYCGATPVFVDVEKDTGNIDANLIKKAITKHTKAIIVVHLYGQMVDMKAIRTLARKYHINVIEDAAHCIEGKRDGIRVGHAGDVSCFSFYATKTMTSGEGGAIACHTKKAYGWFIRARSHGISKSAADRYTKTYEHYDMEFLGYKCNMTNIQAALLINQMDHLQENLKKRQAIAHQYTQAFVQIPEITLLKQRKNAVHALYIFTILVDAKRRDAIMHELQQHGIGVAVNFRPIHLMKYYREKYGYKKGAFPNAESIGARTITIPLYPKLSIPEIKLIISTVLLIVRKTAK